VRAFHPHGVCSGSPRGARCLRAKPSTGLCRTHHGPLASTTRATRGLSPRLGCLPRIERGLRGAGPPSSDNSHDRVVGGVIYGLQTAGSYTLGSGRDGESNPADSGLQPVCHLATAPTARPVEPMPITRLAPRARADDGPRHWPTRCFAGPSRLSSLPRLLPRQRDHRRRGRSPRFRRPSPRSPHRSVRGVREVSRARPRRDIRGRG